jgi:hypothetical protein
LLKLTEDGLVKRFKTQPFDFSSIGGKPGQVPDLLVELCDPGGLVVVQVKSSRFVDSLNLEKLQEQEAVCHRAGFGFKTWTERTPLTDRTRQWMLLIDGGRRVKLDDPKSIADATAGSTSFGALRSAMGLEVAKWLLAHRIVHVNYLGGELDGAMLRQHPIDPCGVLFSRDRRHADGWFAHLFGSEDRSA